jgi:hypothetical protein
MMSLLVVKYDGFQASQLRQHRCHRHGLHSQRFRFFASFEQRGEPLCYVRFHTPREPKALNFFADPFQEGVNLSRTPGSESIAKPINPSITLKAVRHPLALLNVNLPMQLGYPLLCRLEFLAKIVKS